MFVRVGEPGLDPGTAGPKPAVLPATPLPSALERSGEPRYLMRLTDGRARVALGLAHDVPGGLDRLEEVRRLLRAKVVVVAVVLHVAVLPDDSHRPAIDL